MKKFSIILITALCASVQMFGMSPYEQYQANQPEKWRSNKIDEMQQRLREYDPITKGPESRPANKPLSIQEQLELAHRSQARIPTLEEQRRMQEEINRQAKATDYNDPYIK
jgi:hypothetical protein